MKKSIVAFVLLMVITQLLSSCILVPVPGLPGPDSGPHGPGPGPGPHGDGGHRNGGDRH